MVGFGVSDFLAKKTIDKIGDSRTLFYSQLIGVVLLLPYLAIDKSLPTISGEKIVYILLFGFFNFAGYLALYRSFKKGKVSVVAPVSSSYAVVAVIVSFLFFGEVFSSLKIAALGLVIVGVIFAALDFEKLKDGLDSSDFSKGVRYALLALSIFGFYIPFWDAFIEGSGWILWVILVRIILAFFLFFYSLLVEKENILLNQKPVFTSLFLIAFFEAGGSFGSAWAYNSSVGTTSLIVALTSAYSLITAVLAYFFLKERLVTNQYIGLILIILGLLLMPFLSG